MWTLESLSKEVQRHDDPSNIEGFVRKPFCGKGSADLSVSDGAREFLAKITTNIRDRDSEIIDPNGIDFSYYRKNPVILWGHDYNQPAIGRSMWIKKWTEHRKTKGWISKGTVAHGTEKAEDVFKLMQQGVLNTVSIGFVPIEGHKPTDDEIKKDRSLKEVRYIHDKISMLEYSIVNVPANPEATIEAVSKGVLNIPVALQQDMGIYKPIVFMEKKSVPYAQTAVDGIMAGWSLKEETDAATLEELALMSAWFDSDNSERKTSYKFIHHRAGQINALVWEGLAQAMSRLNTFVDRIPDDDRYDVYKHLARHYDEFGKKPPEFMEKAEHFSLTKIPTVKIHTREPVKANEPIKIETIPAYEPPPVVKEKLDLQKIKETATETFEIKVLGKV